MRAILVILLALLPGLAGAATYRYDYSGPEGSDLKGFLTVDFTGLTPEPYNELDPDPYYFVNLWSTPNSIRSYLFWGMGFDEHMHDMGLNFTFTSDFSLTEWMVTGWGADGLSESVSSGNLRTGYGRSYSTEFLERDEFGMPIIRVARNADGTGTWTRAEVLPAPLPAPALLLLGGLAGLGLLGRRRQPLIP